MARKSVHAACTATMILLFASTASAQLPSASTRALGMGDNATAAAAGFNAVAWNPALLGLPNNPKASFALLPLRGIAGLGPVELGDIADYSGEFVPNTSRIVSRTLLSTTWSAPVRPRTAALASNTSSS